MKIPQIMEAMTAKYAIHPQYGMHLATLATMLVQGRLEVSPEAWGFTPQSRSYVVDMQENPTGSHKVGRVGVIQMHGPLFKQDQFCGPEGMASIGKRIRSFDGDAEIDAILLDVDTPGGTVNGTETLAQIIEGTEKPVIVWGENIHSGGVYSTAGASHIMLSGRNASMGSIGVQISYYDFTQALKEAGIDLVTIKASTSPDKNKYNFQQPSDEDKALIATGELDPIDQHFMDWVREHRPGLADDSMTGDTYFAEAAIERGLADSIGTFNDALQLALDMAGISPITEHSMPQEQPKAESPTVPASTETQELEAAQHRIKALEGQVASKDRVIVTHLATIKDLETEVKGLKSENTRLAQLPATDPEAAVASPKEDKTPAAIDQPAAPQEVLAIINRNKRRDEYRAAQQKQD